MVAEQHQCSNEREQSPNVTVITREALGGWTPPPRCSSPSQSSRIAAALVVYTDYICARACASVSIQVQIR